MASSYFSGSPSDINGLRVFALSQHDFQDLQPGSTLFDCTASVISLAMDLIECRSSILALKNLTRRIIAERQDVPDLRNIGEDDIEPKIQVFLRTIRGSFPHVVISSRYGMADKNGRTNKQDCSGVFEPKTATVIEINEILMQRLADACRVLKSRSSEIDTHHFRTLQFRLAITVAHELVHVYNLFLRRGRLYHTPPRVTYGNYGDDETGESGRYWEYLVLGGFVDMRDSITRASERMEAVAIRDAHGQRAWRIKSVVVDGILQRDFNRLLEPGVPLNDPEHPRNYFTEQLSDWDWKGRFFNVFPATLSEAERIQQLPPSYIEWLTGDALRRPYYTINGPDLKSFALQPLTSVRFALVR